MSDARKNVLVVGGTSDIGRAIALRYGQAGYEVILAVRDLAAGERNARDIALRTGAPASAVLLDILATERYADFLAQLTAVPTIVVCAVGVLGDQKQAEESGAGAAEILRGNYEGPALLLALLAHRMAPFGGTIIGISSVAGDRGRGSNFFYSSAKAGFTAFLSGLRNRYHKDGLHVMTVKPGFVRTKMTQALALPGLLTAAPDEVAKAVVSAAERKVNVLYVRKIWLVIMTIITAIPERIFKKLSL